MRLLQRLSLCAATLALATLAFAGPALAGGWAEVTLSGATEPPVAGQPHEVRFTLLQHGVTPVAFGDATLTASLPGTDETVTVPAQALGDGEWAATIIFPVDGAWEITVRHSELETTAVMGLAVGEATSGAATAAGAGGASQIPAFLAVAGVALITVLALGISRRRGSPATVVRAG